MLKTRVIPCLLLQNESLVKTVKFNKYNYIGDPINTVRIFNELEVDELIFLDITATRENRKPNFNLLADIANECFMPLAYGGGIRNIEDAKKILTIGLEKIAINSYAVENPSFITELANLSGSQSVIVSIDTKRNFFGKYEVYTHGGKKRYKLDPVQWSKELEERGAGELLITSMEREGTWTGYDIDLISKITSNAKIPVIANGGAGKIEDIGEIVKKGGASAVALGSMVVFQGKELGILVNFPDKKELNKVLK